MMTDRWLRCRQSNMGRGRRSTLVGLMALLLCAGCGGGDNGPPQEVVEACRGWVKATCTRSAQCTVFDPANEPAAIDECIAENEKAGTCQSMAKLKGCTAEVAANGYRTCQHSSEQAQCKDCIDKFFGCGSFCVIIGCSN
jgi:hypothetical protein